MTRIIPALRLASVAFAAVALVAGSGASAEVPQNATALPAASIAPLASPDASAIAATAAPAVPEKPLTPQRIYLKAVHAMKAAPIPPYVTFRENIAGRNFLLSCTSDGLSLTLHHGDVARAYDVYFRSSDGSAVSKPVPAESASPCPGALLQPAGAAISSMGVPQASPSPGAATSAAPSDASGASGGLPIIAAVRVEAVSSYRIELVGRDPIGSNDTYHLKLTAYRDPDTHPLTDLFIDTQSFLVREARGEVSGHYVIASGRFAGIVDFDRVGNYWLVQHEHFDVAANALLIHARMDATVDGSNYTTPDALPDIVFPTPEPTASPKAGAKSSPQPSPSTSATASPASRV